MFCRHTYGPSLTPLRRKLVPRGTFRFQVPRGTSKRRPPWARSPPSLDILTVNALIAANSVLIPIQCEYFALEGVSELMETIRHIRRVRNPELQIEGVLLTMFDERTNLSHQVMEDLKTFFGDHLF